jgi:cell division septation protein DedD
LTPSDFDSLDAELAEIDGKGGASPRKSSRLLPAIVAFITLVSFGVIVVYAYNQGIHEGSENAAPVLRVEGPSKVPPQNSGGLKVPNQDKLVYNQIGEQQVGEAVERLLPPPETPLPIPTANAAAAVPAPPPKLTLPVADLSEKQASPTAPVMAAAPSPPVPPPVPEAPKATAPPARLATQPQQTAIAKKSKPTVLARSPSQAVATRSPFRIQIASMTNPAAANIEWNRRVEQHKDILGGLTLVVDRAVIAGKGTFYRVQAGPLPSREAASALCDKLKQRKVGCLVVQR